eukprot:GFYU01003282.1.p2 GENE.GFYU01003282.1~~GFYU01003282.1.p2  ORF type:complete len:168 (+),score=63.13 GFYU01003282.1:32-505(+)
MSLRFTALVLIALAVVSFVHAGEPRGWGPDIDWHNDLDAAKAAAVSEGKPIMVLIFKTWCGACKRLKPVFANSKAIADAAKKFVMVNLQDDEEPTDAGTFAPDGAYIPRIIFLDSQGKAQHSIINEGGNPSYKYFYSGEKDVVASMNKALTGAKDEL